MAEYEASYLERFKAKSDRLADITGATVDGWKAAQNALRATFEGITLTECHFNALLKLGQHLATYKRQRKQTGQPLSEFQAWTADDRLVVVTAALDQCLEFLNRKLEDMQTFHSKQSGWATVNAWAITRNCYRLGLP